MGGAQFCARLVHWGGGVVKGSPASTGVGAAVDSECVRMELIYVHCGVCALSVIDCGRLGTQLGVRARRIDYSTSAKTTEADVQ